MVKVMKKILSAILILVLLLGVSACSQGGEFEQNEYAKAQMEVIEGLSVSLENKRIVGYKGENDHLIYIVAEYDEDVRKISETTYYFCFNESVYDFIIKDFKDEPELKEIKDKLYFTFKSDKAITGSYAEDVKKLKTEFSVK